MKNKKVFAAVATITLLGGLSVQAQNYNYVSESTASTASWVGTYNVATGATPTAPSGGTSVEGTWYGSQGGSYGTGGFGGTGQTFEVSTAGTLQNVQFVFAGGSANFNIELYDLGAYPASGYPTTPSYFNGVGTVNYNDMLSQNDNFTFYGAAGDALVTLSFDNSDAATWLYPGELYMFTLDPTSTPNNVYYVRGGYASGAAQFNTGQEYLTFSTQGEYQNFEGKSGGTSGVRNMDMAVDTVPEPSTIALGVMGLSSLLLRRRK
jgi:hypothetical protein